MLGVNNVACKGLYVALFISLLFLNIVSGAAFAYMYHPGAGSVPVTGNDICLSVHSSSISTTYMNYRVLGDTGWIILSNVSYGADSINFTIPSADLRQGLYEYFFNDTLGNRFPYGTGTLKLALSDGVDDFSLCGNMFIVNVSENFKDNCNPWTDKYSCLYENYQGQTILAFSKAYEITGNQTYLGKLLNLSLAEVDEGMSGFAKCDHTENDFDCESTVGIGGIAGSERQANMILSEWTAYQLTGNDTIRLIAQSYTGGHADDCDVWAGDFNCTTADNQGLMIQAYLKAYEMTGSLSYLDVSGSLLDFAIANLSVSPVIESSAWAAYGFTGNQTYLSYAGSLSGQNLNLCRRASYCSPKDQSYHILSSWISYEQTGNYSYLRSAIEKSYTGANGSCSSLSSDFSCSFPDEQGLMVSSYFTALRVSPNETKGFYAPRTSGVLQVDKNITFSASMRGFLNNSQLNYRILDDISPEPWENCTLGFGGSCTVNDSYFIQQGVYEYFFNESSGSRFPPDNGTFKLPLSIGNNNFRNKAEGFSGNNPNSDCAPWSGDFSCLKENAQGWMILGYTDGYKLTGNSQYLSFSNSFASSEIDPFNFIATCDHFKGDFDCEKNISLISGPRRQSLMIDSFWSHWNMNPLSNSIHTAERYMSGRAEGCDVWAGDFNCTIPDDQGKMIVSYWNSFRQTNNATIFSVASNLTDTAISMNNSVDLMRGFWKAYEMTGNITYRQKAENLTGEQWDTCLSSDCIDPLETARNVIAIWDAYSQTGNGSYEENAFNKTIKKVNGVCNALGHNYTCGYAEEQGVMIAAYWTAFQSYSVVVGSINVNLTAGNNSNIYVPFNISVFVDNNDTFTLQLIDVVLYLSGGLLTTDNITNYIPSLAPGENMTFNYTIYPFEGGFQSISVDVDSVKGVHGHDSQEHHVFIGNIDVFDENSTHYNVSDTSVYTEEAFNITFSFNNSLNYTLFNLTVCIDNNPVTGNLTNVTVENSSVDFREINNGSCILFPSVFDYSNFSIIWEFDSLSAGTNDFTLMASTEYGSASNYSGSIIVSDPPSVEGPASSSGSTGGSVELTEETYNYSDYLILDILGNNSDASSDSSEYLLENGFELDVNLTDRKISCFVISRKIDENIISLTINNTCSEEIKNAVFYDTIPDAAANSSEDIDVETNASFTFVGLDADDYLLYRFLFSSFSLSSSEIIIYTVPEDSVFDIYDFSAPIFMLYDYKAPGFAIEMLNGTTVNSSSFEVALNSTSNLSDCYLKIDNISYPATFLNNTFYVNNLSYGLHVIEVICNNGDAEASKNITLFVDHTSDIIYQDHEEPIMIEYINYSSYYLVIISLLSFLFAYAFVYRPYMSHRENIYDKIKRLEKHMASYDFKKANLLVSEIIMDYSTLKSTPKEKKKINKTIDVALSNLNLYLLMQDIEKARDKKEKDKILDFVNIAMNTMNKMEKSDISGDFLERYERLMESIKFLNV